MRSAHVLIVGNGVALARHEGRLLARVQWRTLPMFTSSLASYTLAATYHRFDFGFRNEIAEDPALQPLNRRLVRGRFSLAVDPEIRGRLRDLVHRADYVYLRLPSWVAFSAWRLARRLGRPYWLSIHGNWSDAYVSKGRMPTWKRPYHRLMARYTDHAMRLMLDGAAHVFAVGDELSREVAVPRDRLTVFMNALHRRADVWPVRPMNAGRKRFIVVGSFEPRKDVRTAAEAFRRLIGAGHDADLVFVGEGPDRAWLETFIEEHRLEDRITLRGYRQAGAELDAEFRAADTLVLSSTTEGVPKVALEAMVRATAVVATAVGGVPLLLGDGRRGWLVPPAEPQMLADAMAESIRDDEDRRRRVEGAREYVLECDRDYWLGRIRNVLSDIDPRLVRTVS